jgi:hypothetical protein
MGNPCFTPATFAVCLLIPSHALAEPWWVQSLANTPILSPYIAGIRFLDCLYLDTTFASLNEHTRKFPERVGPLA